VVGCFELQTLFTVTLDPPQPHNVMLSSVDSISSMLSGAIPTGPLQIDAQQFIWPYRVNLTPRLKIQI
jgi:hypothetical protein